MSYRIFAARRKADGPIVETWTMEDGEDRLYFEWDILRKGHVEVGDIREVGMAPGEVETIMDLLRFCMLHGLVMEEISFLEYQSSKRSPHPITYPTYREA